MGFVVSYAGLGCSWVEHPAENGDIVRIELEQLGSNLRGGRVDCVGAIVQARTGDTALIVAEHQGDETRHLDLIALVESFPEMMVVHEAGHAVAMQLHGRAIDCIFTAASPDALAGVAPVRTVGQDLEETSDPAVRYALAVELLTVARAGLHAAESLLGWIGSAGSESDLQRVDAAEQELIVLGGDARDRGFDEAMARLAALGTDHAIEIRRVAERLRALPGRMIEGDELDSIVAGITRRW